MKTKAIIEVAGSPKEHIEEVMTKVVEKIKSEQQILKYKIFEAQQKEKLFFTFTEMEIDFSNFEKLIGFCLDYFPSSIEIIDEEVDIKRKELENVTNDLLAKLHEYDMILKNLKAELYLLKNKSIS
ncbi:hypothetical protein J4406_00775 [Candidatus Woesearchaeota archaeon]|nr:hypothetical protein [Candidatus Woesearchaeota archaeon]